MRRTRAWWVIVGICLLALAALLLRELGPAAFPGFLRCWFHDTTGLNCPGCGMTRAAHAALNGRWGEAFRFNPVGMVLLPVAAAGVVLEVVSWVLGKPLPVRLRLGVAGGWILLGIIVGFGIARNIPAWPFTLLAPP